jgi:Ca2+-binding EF-hand superfamily protein
MVKCSSVIVCVATCVVLAARPTARSEDDERLRKLQQELRARFDANGDGWLNAAERETMRLARVKPDRRRERRRGGFQWPADVVERFDSDGDGRLDTKEGAIAGETLKKRWDDLEKKFDADSDGRLNSAEWRTFSAAAASGKVKDIPFWIEARLPKKKIETLRWEMFDADEDGRFDAEELAAARVSLKAPEGERAEIRYTLDCRTPSESVGKVYREPIDISSRTRSAT